MTKVSNYAGTGKVHLGTPSKFPGHVVLFCTGRTLQGFHAGTEASVSCGSCKKKATKEGVEL